MSMLARLNKITPWQAALIIAVLGFAAYSTGLTNPFWGDDILQIVNNVPVHSISNIRLFFEGSTFYNGHGLAPLGGTYYRPLMTTVFSLLYTVFGAHVLAFHLFQLLLCMGCAIILYLVFRYSFKPALALFLSLIFLVHPLNSQVIFAIASMQDALFFFFGILALYILIRFRSIKSLLAAAVCLFLSMLSKETAIVFIAMSLLYLFWWDRKRLYAFIGIMVLPITLYLTLKINAIGLSGNPLAAPIDSLSLSGRLLTAPSILLFYITKLVFPWKLATAYYWVYPTFSVRHVLVPLVIDLAVVALVIYVANVIRKRAIKAQYYTFLFFTTWAFLGLLPYLQIIPLDMTVCETWFYFSMAGVLGMIGIVLKTMQLRINLDWLLVIGIIVILLLGLRTTLRGFDWRNPYSLAYKNISASKEDYSAYAYIADVLSNQGDYSQAKSYALRSNSIYPTQDNDETLGIILNNLQDYSGAAIAYQSALKFGRSITTVQDLAGLTLMTGNPITNKHFLVDELKQYPNNFDLWLYLAILEDRNNDNADSKVSITNATNYGQVPQLIYGGIINNQPFTINVAYANQTITIP